MLKGFVDGEYDVAEWHDLIKERDQWKELAEMRLEAVDCWISSWEKEMDRVDYWEKNANMWRLRANKAKNLAQDLAYILQAIRKRRGFWLNWNDGSFAKWHDLPKTWREYITRG